MLLFVLVYGSFLVFLPWPTPKAQGDEFSEIEKTFEKYADKKLRTEQAFALYHKTVEKIFDTKVKQIFDRYKSPEESARFCAASGGNGPSSNFNEKREMPACSLTNSSNYSTACVAKLARIEYEGLKKAMILRRDILDENAECLQKNYSQVKDHVLSNPNKTILDKGVAGMAKYLLQTPLNEDQQGDDDSAPRGDDLLRETSFKLHLEENSARSNFIETELNTQAKTLELALKAYDEFYWSFPMHVQYQETIKLLKEYNQGLMKVRQKIEDYKGKFDNASTTKCT